MGGFEVSGTGTLLDFTGTAYEGLEVKVDEVPVGLLMDIVEKYTALTGDDVDVKQAMAIFGELVTQFSVVLEEWNATRKGAPVPATLDGLRLMGKTFVMAVIGAWLTGTVSAPPPLPGNSDSGGSSAAALAAMAASSSGPPSSSPQRLLSGSATAGTACHRR